MDKIWANRLVAGTKTWAEMPASRRPGVKRELAKRVAEEEITAAQYKEITGASGRWLPADESRRQCAHRNNPECSCRPYAPE